LNQKMLLKGLVRAMMMIQVLRSSQELLLLQAPVRALVL